MSSYKKYFILFVIKILNKFNIIVSLTLIHVHKTT